ncbi:MAG: hypothetical protein ACLFWL_08090 [Candidatus Brocadiia bacterium]
MSNRTQGGLAAGSARADITPEPGIQLAGDCGRHRPVEGVKEPLYARALVLESGETRLCLLSLDLLGATNACADEVRERVADALGIDSEAVMFHVTQNHAEGFGRFEISRGERTGPGKNDFRFAFAGGAPGRNSGRGTHSP